jgi:hypothetical protein
VFGLLKTKTKAAAIAVAIKIAASMEKNIHSRERPQQFPLKV